MCQFNRAHPMASRWLSRDPLGEYAGINIYGYVLNDPVNGIDPFGLCTYSAAHLASDATNFLAGLGNAVSFGGTAWLAKQLSDPSGAAAFADAQGSGAFRAGEWASLALGAGRLAYAGIAKGASLAFAAGDATMADAAASVAFRNGLKQAFRLNPFSTFRVYPFGQIAAKYQTAEAIIAAAGRTDTTINALGGVAAAGGAITLTG